MRTLRIMFVICLFLGQSYGQEDFDFRKTRWGMTEVEVKASETGGEWTFDHRTDFKSSLGSVLVYKGQLFGVDCELTYNFSNVEKRLNRASYGWEYEDTKYKNKQIYDRIKDELYKTYGTPESEYDSTKKGLHDAYGMSEDKYEETELSDLGLPHFLRTSWDTPDKRTDVSIKFYLTGEYDKGDIKVTYRKKLTSKEIDSMNNVATDLPNFTYTNPNLPDPADPNQGDYSTNETTDSYKNIVSETTSEIFYFILALICGVVAYFITTGKGGNRPGLWFLWGLLLGPLAIILALFLSGPKCPKCQSRIHKDAQICPKCNSELKPQKVQKERDFNYTPESLKSQ